MNKKILILGSGKMAFNLGMYFYRKGGCIYWTSQKSDYLTTLNKKIKKRVRSMHRFLPDELFGSAHVIKLSDIKNIAPDIILESSKEDLSYKRQLLRLTEQFLSFNDRLVISNSSSILPQIIHPKCCGLHFFYPVELTKLCEAIVPSSNMIDINKIKDFSELMDITTFFQFGDSAFAINRLLLPLQNEASRLFNNQYSTKDIDEFTKSKLFPFGIFSFMQKVGFATIRDSIFNYRSRMSAKENAEYVHLAIAIDTLLKDSLAFNRSSNVPFVAQYSWKDRFEALGFLSCCNMIAAKYITKNMLKSSIKNIFTGELDITALCRRDCIKKASSIITSWRPQLMELYFSALQ